MPNILTRSPYYLDVKDIDQYDVFANIYYLAIKYAGKTMSAETTRINQSRIIADLESNAPRIDYLNNSPELLLEPRSTNLLRSHLKPNLSPNTFTNTTSPDGTDNAVIPTFDTSSNNRFKFSISGGSYSTGQSITYSYYVKRLIPQSSEIVSVFGELDLVPNSNLNLVTPHAKIESDVQGFDRYSATYEIVNGSSLSELKMFYDDAMGDVQGSVAYWGHQAEPLEYATSLIKSTSNSNLASTIFSNIRTKDEVLSVDGNSSYNGEEGVLYFEGSALYDSGDGRVINLYEDANTYVRISYDATSNTIRATHKVNGVTLGDFSTSDYDVTENNKIAYKWSPNTLSFNVNGNLIGASVPSTSPSGNLQALDFQSSALGGFFYGRIRKLKVINQELNQTDIELLTQNNDTSTCVSLVPSYVSTSSFETLEEVKVDLFLGDIETSTTLVPVLLGDLVTNSQFNDTSSWSTNRGSLTASNGVGTFVVDGGTTAGQKPDIYQTISVTAGTTYNYEFRIKSNGQAFRYSFEEGIAGNTDYIVQATSGYEVIVGSYTAITNSITISIGAFFPNLSQVIGGFTLDVDYFSIGDYGQTEVEYVVTEPSYSITKKIDATGSNFFEIGTLINDYMETNLVNGYESSQLDVVAVPYITGDGQNVRLDTICYSCYEGYGYTEQGVNPDIDSENPNILLSTDVVYRVDGENTHIPIRSKDVGTTFLAEGSTGAADTDTDTAVIQVSNNIEYYTGVTDATTFKEQGTDYEISIKELDCTGNTPTKVTFVNKYGALEDIWFMGRVLESLNTSSSLFSSSIMRDGSYDTGAHANRVLNKRGNSSLVLNSGFYPEDYNEAFKQLLLSESVWVSYDGSVRPINISSSDLMFKTSQNNKLINYQIEVNLSYNLINNLQ